MPTPTIRYFSLLWREVFASSVDVAVVVEDVVRDVLMEVRATFDPYAHAFEDVHVVATWDADAALYAGPCSYRYVRAIAHALEDDDVLSFELARDHRAHVDDVRASLEVA